MSSYIGSSKWLIDFDKESREKRWGIIVLHMAGWLEYCHYGLGYYHHFRACLCWPQFSVVDTFLIMILNVGHEMLFRMDCYMGDCYMETVIWETVIWETVIWETVAWPWCLLTAMLREYVLQEESREKKGLIIFQLMAGWLQPRSLVKRLGVDFVFTPSQWQSQPHQKRLLEGNLRSWTLVCNLILTQLDET